MPGSLRVFTALALVPDEAEAIAAWFAERLAATAGLRLVPAANLHVTLVFCGALPQERADEVVAVLGEEAGARLAPVRLAPARVAVLGSVVALVLRPVEGGDELAALQERLARRLVAERLARAEARPWLPHITVARARGRGVRPRPGRVEPPAGEVSPSGVAVYTTVPVHGGVTYRSLAHIGFDARAGGDQGSSQGG